MSQIVHLENGFFFQVRHLQSFLIFSILDHPNFKILVSRNLRVSILNTGVTCERGGLVTNGSFWLSSVELFVLNYYLYAFMRITR